LRSVLHFIGSRNGGSTDGDGRKAFVDKYVSFVARLLHLCLTISDHNQSGSRLQNSSLSEYFCSHSLLISSLKHHRGYWLRPLRRVLHSILHSPGLSTTSQIHQTLKDSQLTFREVLDDGLLENFLITVFNLLRCVERWRKADRTLWPNDGNHNSHSLGLLIFIMANNDTVILYTAALRPWHTYTNQFPRLLAVTS
jgi:hypothetical protein